MKDQTPSKLRLVLLDDHCLFRVSLSRLLSSEPGFVVAGECGTHDEALAVLKDTPVDVVLSDFVIGTERGTEFISSARQAGYCGRFLIVSGSTDLRRSALALKVGASGVFLKSDTPEHLIQAIGIVGNGGTWIDPAIVQRLADQLIEGRPRAEARTFGASLEGREQDVLGGILEGITNRKIGERTGLSESTVKYVVQRLFGKARVHTRAELVRVALQATRDADRDFYCGPPGGPPLKSSDSPDAVVPGVPAAGASHRP